MPKGKLTKINNFLNSTTQLAGKFYRNGFEYPYRRVEDTPIGSTIRGIGHTVKSPIYALSGIEYLWSNMKKGYWNGIHSMNIPSMSVDIPIPRKDYSLHLESSQMRLDDVMMSYPFIASTMAAGFAASIASLAVVATPASYASVPLAIAGIGLTTAGSWSLEERQKLQNFLKFQTVLDRHFQAAEAAGIPVSYFPIGQVDEHGHTKMPNRNKADYAINLTKMAANSLSNVFLLTSPAAGSAGFPLLVTGLSIKAGCIALEASRLSTRTWALSKQEREISKLAESLNNKADLLIMTMSIDLLEKANEKLFDDGFAVGSQREGRKNHKQILKLKAAFEKKLSKLIENTSEQDPQYQKLLSLQYSTREERFSTLTELVKVGAEELRNNYVLEVKESIAKDIIQYTKPNRSKRHQLKLNERVKQNLMILENFGEEKPDPISIAREHLNNKKTDSDIDASVKRYRQLRRLDDKYWVPLSAKPIDELMVESSKDTIRDSLNTTYKERRRILHTAGKVTLPPQLTEHHRMIFERSTEIVETLNTLKSQTNENEASTLLKYLKADNVDVQKFRNDVVDFLKNKITDLYHRYDHAEANADKFKYYKKAEKLSKALGALGVRHSSVREVASEIEKQRIDQGLDPVQVELKPHHHWQAKINRRQQEPSQRTTDSGTTDPSQNNSWRHQITHGLAQGLSRLRSH